MALNFQQFNTAGPNNKVSDIIKGIASGRPTNQEYASLKAEGEIQKSLSTLYNLSNSSFSEQEILDAEEALKLQNIPNAFESWATLTGDMSNREKVALKRSGMNAVEYAKLYNGYKNSYMNRIEGNLLNVREMGKLSGSDMRGMFKDATKLRSFINMNSVNPDVKSFVTPKRTAFDQISDFGGMLMPKADDTLGELATSLPGIALGGAGAMMARNKFKTGSFFGGGGASGGAGPASSASGTGGIGGTGPGPKTTIMQKARNIGNSIKGKGGKLTMESAKNWLKSRIGSKGLVNVLMKSPKTPYTLLAVGLAYGLYSAVKNKDKYQGSLDQRMEDTYGGGPVDTSGAAGIEAARQKMADYNAKYGR